MWLIPVVLVMGGILALVLYLEKRSPPYRVRLRRLPTSRPPRPHRAPRRQTVAGLQQITEL
jgi:hypothetical protein